MLNLFTLKPHTAINVNLLPKDPFSDSIFGKLLNWTLSVGRYIVVFTEVIVILTFLSRFTLDRQLTDLNESILKKQSLLESYSSLETTVRGIQNKAQFISTIKAATDIPNTLDYLLANFPQDILFDSIDINQDNFVVVGRAFSQQSLSQFVNFLKSNPNFQEVSIDQLRTSEDDLAINFIIRTKSRSIPTPRPQRSSSTQIEEDEQF